MMVKLNGCLCYGVLLCCSIILPCLSLTPVLQHLSGVRFKGAESDGGYYRTILIDRNKQEAFIGARNYVYKLKLPHINQQSQALPVNTDVKVRPNFGLRETMEEQMRDRSSEVNRLINNLTYAVPLIVYEKLSQVYKLENVTFEQQCRRQVRALKMYYGEDQLQMPFYHPDVLCTRHMRGLTWLNQGESKLLLLKTGLFGTMPVAPTGVSNYEKGWPAWYNKSAALAIPGENDLFSNKYSELYAKIAASGRTCYSCNYSTNVQDCSSLWTETEAPQICYREYSIPNDLGIHSYCDFTPAPTRVVLNSESMQSLTDGPLTATERDSCLGGNLASTLLTGYHPDQKTITILSETGNGADSRKAVYILTEIGQEKQLDVNHEAFMGFEEPAPLTGSSSLALVRLLVDGDDVDPHSIVISNPFKETWVTSPLTKFGKLVKTGNQATVPHRPRAVTLFENGDYVYFFFREDEWETMQQPEYSVNRYHFLWKSYDRTISYPWERPNDMGPVEQLERTEPAMYSRELHRGNYNTLKFKRNQHVYSPTLQGWEKSWHSAKMVSRVGRVCKNDAGLPLGVQDASVFNLDNMMSLSAFQTYLKATLKCSVKVPATPRSWRFREDVYSFYYKKRMSWFRKGHNIQQDCLLHSGCLEDCTENYDAPFSRQGGVGRSNGGVNCAMNLHGKDVPFRAFLDYAVGSEYFLNPDGLFQSTVNGWTQFHWAYLKNLTTYTATTYTYTELRDLYRVGGVMYGVFTSPLSEELDKAQYESIPPTSAVCRFTMADIRSAFKGAFKKRINNAWRPVGSGDITPNPLSCQGDPIEAEARNIKKMDIEFSDETLPLEQELKNFDMRSKSERLNFFEKDVEGSRTMWDEVDGSAFYTKSGITFDKITAEIINPSVTVLYIATTEGEIHKVASWHTHKRCWQPRAADLDRWWTIDTNLKNNSWYNYFDLTQENFTTASDFVYDSAWNCTGGRESHTVAVYKPFSDAKVTIWDMKLTEGLLVLATDKSVVSINTAQCDKFEHCSECSRDPHCGWNKDSRTCQQYAAGLIQNVKRPANCKGCLLTTSAHDPGSDILLNTTVTSKGDYSGLYWYQNGTMVEEEAGRRMITRNNSLLILNFRPADVGVWELRDSLDSNLCIVQHQIQLSDCVSETCLYERKYGEWCTEYDKWRVEVNDWGKSMLDNGCASN